MRAGREACRMAALAGGQAEPWGSAESGPRAPPKSSFPWVAEGLSTAAQCSRQQIPVPLAGRGKSHKPDKAGEHLWGCWGLGWCLIMSLFRAQWLCHVVLPIFTLSMQKLEASAASDKSEPTGSGEEASGFSQSSSRPVPFFCTTRALVIKGTLLEIIFYFKFHFPRLFSILRIKDWVGCLHFF